MRPLADSPIGRGPADAATAGRLASLVSVGLLVSLVVLTVSTAEQSNGGNPLTYVLAGLLALVSIVAVGFGVAGYAVSATDEPQSARLRATQAMGAAAVALIMVFLGFDRIRSAFDTVAAKVEAGNNGAITSGWATFFGVLCGLLLFLIPTLLASLLQRSPDTSHLVGRFLVATGFASLGVGIAGLLTAYGGEWVPKLVDTLPNRVAAGILTGSILAVAGLGLSLVFGVLKLVNFAHAQFLLVGAYVALWFNNGLGWNIWVAIIPAALVGAGLGVASDVVLWKPMRDRGIKGPTVLILSIGFGLFLQYLVFFASRGDSDVYEVKRETRTPLFGWSKVQLTPTEYTLIVVSVVLVGLVALLLTYTSLGKAVRAAADNADLAQISGINVDRVILAIWVVAGALATYGGVAASLQFNVVTPLLGLRFILPIFAAVIVGGLGNAYGALVGGLLLGLAQEVSPVLPFVTTEYQEVVGFVFLVLVLVLRPQGLLGVKERI
ncbi:MAG: branched-chain amino acid ABC transporter permease [Actinomycetia bacterium]|nr:branched-chain amino acid ABC transporter permease [Actinomycetes bacterium]